MKRRFERTRVDLARRACTLREKQHDAGSPASGAQRQRAWSSASRTSIRSHTAARKAFRELGAEVAITYLNEKARPYVEPLAKALEAPLFLPLDVSVDGQLEAVFDAISAKWGQLDIVVHSIAFAPKEDLQGGLINCSAAGFAKAMDVSCHSFVADGAACGAAHDKRRTMLR
jgi:enoyl-[acyl-carrier-protein] reductase (NADH)